MKTFYACGVDWQHELGEAPDLEGKMPLYSSINKLKAMRTCWQECGIVEIKLELSRWVEPQDFFGKRNALKAELKSTKRDRLGPSKDPIPTRSRKKRGAKSKARGRVKRS